MSNIADITDKDLDCWRRNLLGFFEPRNAPLKNLSKSVDNCLTDLGTDRRTECGKNSLYSLPPSASQATRSTL